ncbi:hypothetical protein [Mycolicibacterium sp.]|uniref:hypothetical protein n=1 Tax=Mycolicibacterium sp. TaxID=2320850 RepID=UPI001D3F201E|nr:hypothetical protein [Mycolicibacterium sp.]MCB1291922.1 hypothetical protein [Mycobacterium sp.]MCB9409093.1 hypothetical protein [Mycolicibacterium sp.]
MAGEGVAGTATATSPGRRSGFEDAPLLDDCGDVTYYLHKNVDLGTNIHTGAFNGSRLRGFQTARRQHPIEVWQRGFNTDPELYPPSTIAPTT